MPTITVIDGQGGGIGRSLIEACRAQMPDSFLVAAGTNAAATSAMVKAGANVGATGENAICYNATHCDVLLAPIGAAFANSMYGEITEKMACAISNTTAKCILIPLSKCHVCIAGVANKSVSSLIEEAVSLAKEFLG